MSRPRRITRSRTSLRPFAAVAAAPALCAALVASTPSAAQAQTVTDADAVGDMLEIITDVTSAPAPDETVADVLSTRLTHGVDRIRIRVEHVDLRRTAYYGLYVTMLTHEDVHRLVNLEDWPGRAAEISMTNRREREVTCAVRHSVDYAAEVVRVSFPRRCASDPRWVRFGAATLSSGTDDGFYVDDALRDESMNDDLVMSGRVYRDDAG